MPEETAGHLAGTARIAVLGAGSWGTALAALLTDNGHSVCLWAREEELIADLSRSRENVRYLPGIALPEPIQLTADLRSAMANAEIVVFAIPSGALRAVARGAACLTHPEALLISAAKGLEDGTGLRMSEVLGQIYPDAGRRTAVLSGPNLAVEVARGIPTASVAASALPEPARRTQALFTGQSSPTFRVYTSNDVVGVELGGAIKNAIAIGAGVCDGLGFGDNAKAGLMTRGLAEAVRLGLTEGAQMQTFLGLSGVGDLVATAGSRLSRNYRVGFGLGQGRALPEILAGLGQVAEGVPTTRALCSLARKNRVEMPLCASLYEVLFAGRSPQELIRELMLRPPKEEAPSQ